MNPVFYSLPCACSPTETSILFVNEPKRGDRYLGEGLGEGGRFRGAPLNNGIGLLA
jgi:hypothetical protein